MKKFLALLLIVALTLSLFACAKRPASVDPGIEGKQEPDGAGAGDPSDIQGEDASQGEDKTPEDESPEAEPPEPAVYPDAPLTEVTVSVGDEELEAMREVTDMAVYFLNPFKSASELSDSEMFFMAMVLNVDSFYTVDGDPYYSYVDVSFVQPAVTRLFGSEAKLSDGWLDMPAEDIYPYEIDKEKGRIGVMGMGLPWPCQYTVYAAKTGENTYEIHRLYLSDPLFEQKNGSTYDAYVLGDTDELSFELVRDIANDMMMCRYVFERVGDDLVLKSYERVNDDILTQG